MRHIGKNELILFQTMKQAIYFVKCVSIFVAPSVSCCGWRQVWAKRGILRHSAKLCDCKNNFPPLSTRNTNGLIDTAT